MKTTVQYNNILTTFSTGRLSSEAPYPFIYHFSRTGYPFRAESPRKGHYRESPLVAHTSTHDIRTWICLLANAKIKNKQKNLFLLNTEDHHGHHWQSSRGTWLTPPQRMFYSCRSSEILTLVLPCFYWNRTKLCVVAILTGLFARCCLFRIWRFFTLHNGYESPSLAQLPRGESK